MACLVKKIISGAQTGADRAGLDAGLVLGMEVGGCVPKGRRTERGRLTDGQMLMYGLHEHDSPAYPPRTEWNVKNSCATVLFGNMSSPGCRLTLSYCRKHNKPHIINPTAEQLQAFCDEHTVIILNVAGNRESTNPGIYNRTYTTLIDAFGPSGD